MALTPLPFQDTAGLFALSGHEPCGTGDVGVMEEPIRFARAAATTNDGCLTATIHAHRAGRDLLPQEHVLDTGSMTADGLVTRQQQHQVNLVGPVLSDNHWQARQPDSLDVSCLAMDWDAQHVLCPAGKGRTRWTPGHEEQGAGQASIAIPCDPQDGQDCPLRPRCTQAKTGPRTMNVRPRDQHIAVQTARRRQVVATPLGAPAYLDSAWGAA